MSRKPLSAKNQVEYSRGQKGSSTKSKKGRYPFPLLDKPSLVAALRHVFKEAGSSGPTFNFCEDDLVNPTPERIQQVYFNCLDFAFEVKPDSLKQPFFHLHVAEHPELQDEFINRFQFFKVMKRFMQTCLVNDFTLKDFCSPESRRTIRNLSAIINFFKFHFSVFSEASSITDYQETREDLREEYSKMAGDNSQLQKDLNTIQQQRRQEHDLEEELKQQLCKEEQEISSLKTQAESYHQQLQLVIEQKIKSEQRLAEFKSKLDKWNLRNDDLRKQVVSSPDKLKAVLTQLQQQVRDAKEAAEVTESLIRMWEALASRAEQIPTVLKGLNENLDLLSAKVGKKSDLFSRLESIEEQIGRQRQILREATAKYQNLLRHVKLVEEESEQVAYDGHKVPQYYAKDYLERDVCLLQQEVEQREQADMKVKQEQEEEKEKLSQDEQEFEKACSEIYDSVSALKEAFQSQVQEYSAVMERFDVSAFTD